VRVKIEGLAPTFGEGASELAKVRKGARETRDIGVLSFSTPDEWWCD